MNNLKIFNVNEVEWYVALSKEQLLAYLKQEHEDGWGEIDDDMMIELTDVDLDILTLCNDVENSEESNKKTFREQLRIVVKSGEKIPCMFATSEY